MKKLLFVFAIVILAACSKTDEKKVESTDQQTVTTQETSKPVATQRYGIKSGFIKYNAPMGTNQELYFDDYGAKELFITFIDLGIAKSKTIEIRKEGFAYSYTDGEKEGIKRAYYNSNMDYSKADSKTLERYKVKDLGTETIAGKECKKFSAEFGSSPILTWSWNNIMVKSITKMGSAEFLIEAVTIQETAVDSKMFELPQGVTFKDM